MHGQTMSLVHLWKAFGIGLGVFYTDKTYRTEKNDQVLPAYTLLNGAIYYQAEE